MAESHNTTVSDLPNDDNKSGMMSASCSCGWSKVKNYSGTVSWMWANRSVSVAAHEHVERNNPIM